MAKKQSDMNAPESKTGYTGKYFRYDQSSMEQGKIEQVQDSKLKKEKSNKKKKK